MNRKIFFVLFGLLLPSAAFSQPENSGALKERVEQLEKKVDELEKSKSAFSITKPEPSEISPIEYRESFTDQQEAVPRPDNLTIDPTYRGFIPIPHTHAMIRFNAKPRVDFVFDNRFAGDDNRFDTGQIPVSDEAVYGGGHRFNANAQGSRLSIDVRAPSITSAPRFYYENDFAGTGTADFVYRVRHLYGQIFNFVIGQTYSIFEDADAWPDTIDYEGPNGMISSRRPIFKYQLPLDEKWHMSFSLEKPVSQADTTGTTATSVNRAPEGGLNVRWEDRNIGHAQLAAIFRDISVRDSPSGKQSVFGWGLSLSSSIETYKDDSLQLQLAYGEGIFYLINDSYENGDAAFDESFELQPIPTTAMVGGYTHWWSKKLRSTASFGFVNLENQIQQAGNAYHRTYYASCNITLQIYKRLCAGLEGLYGYKQVKSHVSGDVFRVQVGIMYSLF